MTVAVSRSAARVFQSTLPARGATLSMARIFLSSSHFNPRSPRGERPMTGACSTMLYPFQSTLPARGATSDRGAWSRSEVISIHAPREGSDFLFYLTPGMCYYFNPRSPRGERHLRAWRSAVILIFQSTLPARGATVADHNGREPELISIHAPREGSDSFFLLFVSRLSHFNPRSPRGERPWRLNTLPRLRLNFNPRSPRGERPMYASDQHLAGTFQSTLPARGATAATYHV